LGVPGAAWVCGPYRVREAESEKRRDQRSARKDLREVIEAKCSGGRNLSHTKLKSHPPVILPP